MVKKQHHRKKPKSFNSHIHFISAFDTGADWIWENHNKGKLWKDIKHKYEEAED